MKNKNKPLSQDGGFTLYEVLISIAIFSIGILGTIAMQYAVVGGNSSGNVVSQQMLLAQRVVEQKKNISSAGAIDAAIPSSIDPGPYSIDVSVSNPIGGNFSRFITVTVDRPGGIGGHPVTIRALTMGYGI